MLGSYVYPVLVEPLFNSFEPLPPGDLRTRVLELADKEGVPVRDVLVADASRRTTTLNAYVSGFGGTHRVVLYDNLVEDLPEDQALSVVAHELAHARHRDVLVGSALGAWGVVAGVGVLGLMAGSRRMERRYGPRPLGQPVVVPVLLAVVALAGLAVSPVQNGISRRVETRADVDALRATGNPAAFVAMQKRLATRSLSDPTPPAWARFWFGSHPTVLERVALVHPPSAAGESSWSMLE
jgi:STE24 endopeptidase